MELVLPPAFLWHDRFGDKIPCLGPQVTAEPLWRPSPVLPQDVTTLARALLAQPLCRRRDLCRDLFDAAEQAADHMRCRNQLHPRWGNGTLDAAARTMPLVQEPLWHDPEFIDSLLLVLVELKLRLAPAAEKPGTTKIVRASSWTCP
ncbi:hypothetical protein PH5382_01385 [Phaeobacter sp. CECT 5382]|nr:hypothetical protein PH5382_01385 [Phaeobacter sp. CECT 5382]